MGSWGENWIMHMKGLGPWYMGRAQKLVRRKEGMAGGRQAGALEMG